jgi:hypothetical protein
VRALLASLRHRLVLGAVAVWLTSAVLFRLDRPGGKSAEAEGYAVDVALTGTDRDWFANVNTYDAGPVMRDGLGNWLGH